MRYIVLIFLIGIVSCKTFKNLYSQPTIAFYKSYQDFKKGKAIKTYEVIPDFNAHGEQYFYDSLKVKDKSSVKFITPADYPGNFFSDNNKLLLRYYKGKYFAVLASGKFCYYMDFAYTTFVEGPDGSLMTISKYFGEDAPVLHYFAKGEGGAIQPLTNDFLYPLLHKYKLMDLYNQKKKELGLQEFSAEFSEVYNEVFQLINEKTKM